MIVVFAALMSGPGCVFDTKGVPPFDGGTPDRTVDQRPDRPLIPDEGPAVDPCAKTPPPTGNVCLEDDRFGQSGSCSGSSFSRGRYCFAEAPCQGGFCFAGCGVPCGAAGSCASSGCASGKVCTVLLSPAVRCCCVTPSPDNGTQGAGDACTRNEDCKSGLCTAAGNCLEPCVTAGD